MNYVTEKSLEKAMHSLPSTIGLRMGDLETIRTFCQQHGAPADMETIFWASMAAEAIGFRKGRNYQKHHGIHSEEREVKCDLKGYNQLSR